MAPLGVNPEVPIGVKYSYLLLRTNHTHGLCAKRIGRKRPGRGITTTPVRSRGTQRQ